VENGAIASREPCIDDVVEAFDAIAGALSAEVELDGLMRLIAERVCSVVGVSRCALYLRDSDHGLFRGSVAHPGEQTDVDAWMKRSVAGIEADRFTQEILATKEPVLIADTLHDPRPVRRAMLRWDIRSMLGVPMVLRDEVVGLLFLDNASVPHEFTSNAQRLAKTLADLSAVAISQARRTGEMRATLRTVVRQNRLLHQLSALGEQVGQQILRGASLGEIADSIASATSHPVGVYSEELQRLAVAGAPEDEAAFPRLIEAAVDDVAEARDALSRVEPGHPMTLGPFPAFGVHRRHLVARISGQSGPAGYVVMMEHSRQLTLFDANLARHAATMVGLELSAERRAAAADANALETLVRDLLLGLDEPRSLARRAAFHHLALDKPCVVCVIGRRNDSEGGVPTVSSLRSALNSVEWHERRFCTGDEAGVAVLLPLPSDRPTNAGLTIVKDAASAILEKLGNDHGLIAAVSPVCHRIIDYPRALSECRHVLHWMTTLVDDDRIRVLAATDLGAARLLLASSTPEAAVRFASDIAGQLLEGRERRVLLTTLVAFCDAGRNIRATAATLDIHENTVRYRLGKIAELTGLDVAANADDQLTAQFAVLVFRLRGWLRQWPPDATVSSAPGGLSESPLVAAVADRPSKLTTPDICDVTGATMGTLPGSKEPS
jgi:sugar diacid utilization regulator